MQVGSPVGAGQYSSATRSEKYSILCELCLCELCELFIVTVGHEQLGQPRHCTEM